MLFNSFQFAVFFVIVYSLYLMLGHKWQNRLLLAASYVFYGWWDWRFLGLIFISTATDYFCGLAIGETEDPRKRKFFLRLSLCINLGILGFFKYFNFFASSLERLVGFFGGSMSPVMLQVILPVGISFYTFQTLSYTYDVTLGRIKPTRQFLDFALYISFFPQLVAGPIERASNLLPQIMADRTISREQRVEGSYLILWGLFQKVFMADNLARIVEPIFSAGPPYQGAVVLIALYAFAFQIYGDFAGYSDIARGLGKLMGVELSVNFRQPYLVTNPREWWNHWHISFSTWLRDYLFLQALMHARKRTKRTILWAVILTMVLGGLWHGAAWTYVTWGVYHALILILFTVLNPVFQNIQFKGRVTTPLWLLFRIVVTFHLWCLSLLIFRSSSLTQTFQMLHGLLFNFGTLTPWIQADLTALIFFIAVPLAVQCLQRFKENMWIVLEWPWVPRLAFFVLLLHFLVVFSGSQSKQFIYFQF